MTTADYESVHLIILHHGLWGNVDHVRFIAEQFKQRLGNRLLVYRARANESAFTYDGIDVCGQRLVQEIHSVIKVIESGGNIEEMKGQKLTLTTDKKSAKSRHSSATESGTGSTPKQRRVVQFSFLGYSLGGLIGRFAIAMLDLEGFFTPKDQGGQGIEPMYFVTMATPHLGVRQPSRSRFTKVFNYLSARMLSRTGKPIQYHDEYSSLIESYEHYDQDARAEIAKERAEYLKSISFVERTTIRFKAVPWKRYILFGILGSVLLPVWIVVACSAISVQGFNSRRRTKQIIRTNEELDKMKKEALIVWDTDLLEENTSLPSLNLSQQRLLSAEDARGDSFVTLQDGTTQVSTIESIDGEEDVVQLTKTINGDNESNNKVVATNKIATATPATTTTTSTPRSSSSHVVSYSFPHLKNVRQLRLLPVQIEISRNMNRLTWKKNAIHCATALNAHASIVVREKRFSGKDGIAAVQHAVDMFKDDGEDV
ncbi:hypothetical protein FBU30_001230 [Linnemannia zychae]|nr:hypothetical protein FBU30_001230 [Linnemannia zychae]